MENRRSPFLTITLFSLVLFTAIAAMNHWLERLMQTRQQVKPRSASEADAALRASRRSRPDQVTRHIFQDPSRKYFQSTIRKGSKEVARFKNSGEDIYDIVGEIPDGKISFFNDSLKTYGEEYFRKGRREGAYIEYFETGIPMLEAEYRAGDQLWLKEYYSDGTLRMEVDYQDALVMSKSVEKGKGRIYYRGGTLMYEWDLTNAAPELTTRAYNNQGELVEIRTFDERGEVIKTERPAPPAAGGL